MTLFICEYEMRYRVSTCPEKRRMMLENPVSFERKFMYQRFDIHNEDNQ